MKRFAMLIAAATFALVIFLPTSFTTPASAQGIYCAGSAGEGCMSPQQRQRLQRQWGLPEWRANPRNYGPRGPFPNSHGAHPKPHGHYGVPHTKPPGYSYGAHGPRHAPVIPPPAEIRRRLDVTVTQTTRQVYTPPTKTTCQIDHVSRHMHCHHHR